MYHFFRQLRNASLYRQLRQDMNRPRNRQYRPPRNNNNNATSTSRRTQYTPNSTQNASVPTIQQVIPGASVSIVLKADQPTGREIQGVVKDLLTRGDHPRGIKVRLQDGRIGRVQRMVTGSTSNDAPTTPTSGQNSVAESLANHSASGNQHEATESMPSSNLGDYVIARGKQRRRPSPPRNGLSLTTATIAKCPICGMFEGDEAAVSYHVQQHLDGADESPG